MRKMNTPKKEFTTQSKVNPELNTKPEIVIGTDNVDLKNKLAEDTLKANPRKALELSKEAIREAEALSYKKGIARASMNAGVASRSLSSFDEAFKYCEKAVSL